ncbi:transporter substrate-binding domain-containing protein [Pararoseomonas sp. SCSIO 73927]|uniref:transporter substrate-binding domain-containing protein n=1 Tax=Pararoseomonas sp. SCSIO 73927 TaxID=3114537 RepID=UPI0030CA7777
MTLLSLLVAGSAAQAQNQPLRTAVDASFPPHAFTRLDGKLDGFQIDLGTELGRRLGREVQVDGTTFAGLIPALNAGRYDFILAPVTATTERAENLFLTEGYLFTAYQFGIRRGSAPITGPGDLRGKVIAVNKGSAYDAWTRENADRYGFTPLVLDGFTDATLAVVQGRAYAQLGGNTTIRYAAQRNRQFTADLVLRDTRAHWSLVARRGDTAMREMLENALECMKLDGTLARLSEKWFGTAPEADDAERVAFPGYGVPGMAGYDPTPHTPRCN